MNYIFQKNYFNYYSPQKNLNILKLNIFKLKYQEVSVISPKKIVLGPLTERSSPLNYGK